MTQSDSPDFEFDPANLDVDGNEATAPEHGESVSEGESVPETEYTSEVSQEQGLSEREIDDDDAYDEDDAELAGFDIDALPDAFSAPVVNGVVEETVSDEAEAAEAESEDSAEPVAEQPVERIEKSEEARPMRDLGPDDLGADVFAEIDDSDDVMSFDDVLEDLMEQVDEFEAGGVIDLDEEAEREAAEAAADDIFKLDDPDDSLQQSVDPNAEAPARPKPSAEPPPKVVPSVPKYEKPDLVSELMDSIEDAALPQPVEAEAQVEPESPQTENAMPQTPVEDRAEAVRNEDPAAGAPKAPSSPAKETTARSTAPEFRDVAPPPSEMEIPADPVAEVSESAVVEEVADEIPAKDQSGSGRDLTKESDEPRAPVEGHEKVFFEAPPKEPVVSREDELAGNELVAEEPEVVANEADADEGDDILGSVLDELEATDDVSEVSEAVSEAETAGEDLVEGLEEADTEVGAVSQEDIQGDESSDEVAEDSDADAISEEVEDELDLVSEVESLFDEGEDAGDESEAEASDSQISEESDSEATEISEEEFVAENSEEEALISEAEEESNEEEVDALADAGVLESAEESLEEADEIESIEASVADEVEETAEIEDEESSETEAVGEVDDEDDDVFGDIEALFAEADEEESDEESVESESAVDEPVAMPGLEILDDDEEEEIIPGSSGGEEPAAPGLEVLDDEDEEVVAEAEDGASESEEKESKPAAMPTAEELLMRAGSLLNGGKPIDEANALLEELDDDEEEITPMPSASELLAAADDSGEIVAIEDDDEDDGLVAMPDPSAMMEEASAGGLEVIDEDPDETEEIEEEPKKKYSGDVADRAGDLPPPPPAPIEIIDEDPPDEDEAAKEAEAPEMAVIDDDEDEEEIIAPPVASDEEETELEDPFDSEISLEDFDDDGALEDALVSDEEESGDEVAAKEKEEKKPETVVVEMPKPSLLWRITHSMAVAAGFVLIGAGWVFTIWKQQITEYIEGRDLDGSALVQEIQEIGSHALKDFDEQGLYRMQWVESEVRRVAHNEIRLHALVGAQLKEDLYQPVLESAIEEKYGFDESKLLGALSYAQNNFPEELANFPNKPWRALYKKTASRSEVLPLRITYSITRESDEDDWKLNGVKVRGHKGDLVWPEGEPAYSYGEDAYDVDSEEFAGLLASYREETTNYVAKIDGLRDAYETRLASLQHENEQRRERVKSSMSPGTFYQGMAIVGEDAEVARDVTMVITEVREGGALVKGVFQVNESNRQVNKMFVGSVDFETLPSGKDQGVMTVRTVSMEKEAGSEIDAEFFRPNTVTSMRLKTDGFRLEGDNRDFSLRLTRHL